MKRSNRLVILVGVLLAVLAFVGIVIVLNNSSNSATQAPQKVTVLVAKQDIKIGDAVTPDKVVAQQVDPSSVSGTPFSAPSQLTGRPALTAIPKDSQVNQEAVGAAPGSNNVASQLKPGERAIAIQVDRVTGLGFLVQQGDQIDILISQKLKVLQPTADSLANPKGPQRVEPIPGLEDSRTVKTVLQNKRVLYVSNTLVKSASTGAAASATPAPQGQAAATTQTENVVIIFAGTDQDAEIVKFAQNDLTEVGAISVVVRGTADTATETTTGVTIDLLITKYGVPIPNNVIRP